MDTKKIKRKWSIIIIILVIYISLFTAGYIVGFKRFDPIIQCNFDAAGNNRLLSVTLDSHDQSTVFRPEELGEHIDFTMTYYNAKNVVLEIDGHSVHLENAVADGTITFAQILCYAQMDAEHGICEELYESKHGLTHFTYRYPEFDLRIINDIYETPDGKQHYIRNLGFYNPAKAIGPYTDFYSEETGERLDREEWGISFQVTSTASTSITMVCSQAGGQQIGNLVMSHYILCNYDGIIPSLIETGETPTLNEPIQMESSSEISIRWDENYGELPPGDYRMLLYLRDDFEESQVHPLMNDFHTMQRYSIMFQIADAGQPDSLQ